ncbi:unnamed protein product [Polarella glacialis]|uniref:EGF-like domain-containing protein n=1 Tax=Polarella glacialis TaxID=89957 RepID=A0A813GDU1_POLGL|nr:unnamed protein product [Polarella glacialis]
MVTSSSSGAQTFVESSPGAYWLLTLKRRPRLGFMMTGEPALSTSQQSAQTQTMVPLTLMAMTVQDIIDIYPHWCGGQYDDQDFFSGTMCCVCGGGEQRPLEGGGASRKKERGIKCVSNTDISAAMSESSCPVSDGWPLPSTFPSSGASAAAEKGAIRNCTDGPEECTDALCNGHGDATGAAGACACSCHPGYEGDLCQQCAAGFEGYPQCRESCTRVDDCTGHGDASGVKWQNDFGAMLDSCSCTCDLGYHGLHCEGADTTTTTTSTTFLAAGPGAVNLGNACTYAILSKAGISTVPTSTITGNIGVSPIAATAITGFSLTADSANGFATSTDIHASGR